MLLFDKLTSSFRICGEVPQICRVYADPYQTDYPAFSIGITAGIQDVFTLILRGMDGHIHGLPIYKEQARLMLSMSIEAENYNYLIEKW